MRAYARICTRNLSCLEDGHAIMYQSSRKANALSNEATMLSIQVAKHGDLATKQKPPNQLYTGIETDLML